MIETVILAAVLAVPLIVAIELGAGAPRKHQSAEYIQSSAGAFWDRPAGRLQPTTTHGVRHVAELEGDALIADQRSAPRTTAGRSGRLPVGTDEPEKVPLAV